jgi:hypothetical protein
MKSKTKSKNIFERNSKVLSDALQHVIEKIEVASTENKKNSSKS